MDVSATQLQPSKPNQDGSTYSKKKKKIYDGSEQISTSITVAVMLLGENIRTEHCLRESDLRKCSKIISDLIKSRRIN
ncbi:hypothetical protein Goari_002750 [Gossypium aridum]|uniref:Uncharacterized protein n=1 Tax=Gossypium aridum TaxID=34290 RepID=A0A7J8YAW2_GOSAI|nr:hypothetical protein [Gossypium aridum]